MYHTYFDNIDLIHEYFITQTLLTSGNIDTPKYLIHNRLKLKVVSMLILVVYIGLIVKLLSFR